MFDVYLNDEKYKELCQKAYCDMEDEELDYCVETEMNYFMPKIHDLIDNHWTFSWIVACIYALYVNYFIYDDSAFYTELNIFYSHYIDEGYKIYYANKELIEKINPLTK